MKDMAVAVVQKGLSSSILGTRLLHWHKGEREGSRVGLKEEAWHRVTALLG